jgi:hypothetical protein
LPDDGLSLAEAIGEIRKQLEQAKAEGAASSLKFEIGPVQLTFTVEVTKSTSGGGGVHVWVLQAGANRDTANHATQTVSLTISPYEVAEDGSHVPVNVASSRRGRPDGAPTPDGPNGS